MLIDDFMPDCDFRERHATIVRASPEAVRHAIEEWQPQDSLLWRLLLRLRGLGRPHGSLREWAESNGFLRLAEDEHEVAYGQIGCFWSAREREALVSPRTPEEFRRFDDPGYAIAVMSVRIDAHGEAATRLSTETRIRALGPQARRRFRLYWLFVRPFSGLLRWAMLEGMKSKAIALTRGVPQHERSIP